jgi:phage tail sheath protein FI
MLSAVGTISLQELALSKKKRSKIRGVYVQEVPSGVRSIAGGSTSVTAFIGWTPLGTPNEPTWIYTFDEFERHFGRLTDEVPLGLTVRQFFENGGIQAIVVRVVKQGTVRGRPERDDLIGSRDTRTGLYALNNIDSFNLLCLPDTTDAVVLKHAFAYCDERWAFLLMDLPADVSGPEDARRWFALNPDLRSPNAAAYFPRVRVQDRLRRLGTLEVPSCGAVAGVFARTDANRGVWKAPAGSEAGLRGINGLAFELGDGDNSSFNSMGVNCLRMLPGYGNVVWGARTLMGADHVNSEWKYVPVRRLSLFIEESLHRGTEWVVFEPNDEPLWPQIRLNVEAFMHGLFRQGAFQGTTPIEAYFVKCGRDTMTEDDIKQRRVSFITGFAPLKPAEFVVIRITKVAGQTAA